MSPFFIQSKGALPSLIFLAYIVALYFRKKVISQLLLIIRSQVQGVPRPPNLDLEYFSEKIILKIPSVPHFKIDDGFVIYKSFENQIKIAFRRAS